MDKPLRIGQLAQQCGLSPWTIRYYEQVGLLPKAPRSAARYRLYTEDDVQRLGFIQRAKQLGLPLSRIRELLPLTVGSCEHLRPRLKVLIEEELKELDQRLAELTRFREELRASLILLDTSCRPIRGEACQCGEAQGSAVIPASQIRAPRRAGGKGAKKSA